MSEKYTWKHLHSLLKTEEQNEIREYALGFMVEQGINQAMAERAWNMAWELGHSMGYSEVLLFLEDLIYVITGE